MDEKEKAIAYDKALERAKDCLKDGTITSTAIDYISTIFPQLTKSEDEKIRENIIRILKGEVGYTSKEDTDRYVTWLEKQKVADEEIIFRPIVGTDIRIAAKQALEKIEIGKKVVLAFNGAYIPVNGKTVGKIDSEYDAWLEKQVPIDMEKVLVGARKDVAMSIMNYLDDKSVGMRLSEMEREDIEDALINSKWNKLYNYMKKKLEKQGEQQPADKVEPRFKVKYAGSEYNVLEVKDIAGVIFYGIEDEPNHIDYVQAANCERVDGYNIKENGSPFPIKPAKFSKEKPAWNEEDEDNLRFVECHFKTFLTNTHYDTFCNWLKSLRTRLGGSEHDNVTSKTTNVGNSSITVEGMYNPAKDASV